MEGARSAEAEGSEAADVAAVAMAVEAVEAVERALGLRVVEVAVEEVVASAAVARIAPNLLQTKGCDRCSCHNPCARP